MHHHFIARCRLMTGPVLLFALLAVASAQADGRLYFADIFNPTFNDGFVKQVNTDGGGLTTLVTVGGGLRGVAVDYRFPHLYWTDVDAKKIFRGKLDGSNSQAIITSGLAWPMAVAVDPVSGWLFWGDQTLGQIGRAHLDGADATPLISTDFGSGLAVDIFNQKIYWTTADSAEAGMIMRANQDGTQVEIVVQNHDKPARIALDIIGGKVYWTDYVVDVVRRANLDGSDVQTLFTVGENLNPNGIALDLAAGKVYWGQDVSFTGEGYIGKIMRMNLDGSQPEDFVGDLGSVGDIGFLPIMLGDMNCDGAFDGADIDPFFLALADPAAYASQYPFCTIMNGDINGDGSVDGADIDAFFVLLGG